jgi:prefoldin alpha subunit
MENNQSLEVQLSQYRYIKEQKDMFQGQFEIINASLGNLFTTKLTLDNLKEGVNNDDEILVPIGGLVSIKATLKDNKKVLVYVKNDTIIEKTVEEAIEFISKLIEQHNTQLKFLQERIYNLDLSLQSMNQTLQSKMTQQ